MRLQIKGRNVEVSDAIRAHAEQKLAKLDKQLHELTQVEVELWVEKNPSISANNVAEATVWTKGPVLRAREASSDMRSSIDGLAEKLHRKVKHYRDTRAKRHLRHRPQPEPGFGPEAEPDESPPE